MTQRHFEIHFFRQCYLELTIREKQIPINDQFNRIIAYEHDNIRITDAIAFGKD
jgi:hypothetical protein